MLNTGLFDNFWLWAGSGGEAWVRQSCNGSVIRAHVVVVLLLGATVGHPFLPRRGGVECHVMGKEGGPTHLAQL